MIRLVLLIPMLFALMAAPASARMRALLVGVSDYASLDADLAGPENDVPALTDALVSRGFARTDILDLVNDQATRAGILAGLENQTADLAEGDLFLFYFSGHGTRVPDQGDDEAGGADEVLLPHDAQNWDPVRVEVTNALLDDELRAAFEPLLARGVQVIAILDSCHSATGFRALGSDTGRARLIDPESLGIPETDSSTRVPDQTVSGKFAYLYSSQSDERSFEHPQGDAGAEIWHGDFTLGLISALNQGAPTWEAALESARDRLVLEGIDQNPDGEGPMLASAIPGASGSESVTRFAITDGKIDAGLLQGLTEGSSIALYASRDGGESLAEGTVTSVSALAASSDLAGATGYVEIVAPAPAKAVIFAPPVALDDGDYTRLLAAIAEVQANPPEGIAFGQTGQKPDLGLALVAGELVLADASGQIDAAGDLSSPRLQPGESLADFLTRAARVVRLERALLSLGGKASFRVKSADLEATARILAASRNGDTCAAPGEPLPADAPLAVSDCDQVWIDLANPSRHAMDVTLLYVDADLNVQMLWPEAGLSNRLTAGESTSVGIEIENMKGRHASETLLILAVPAEPGAPRTVLDALADPEEGQSRALPTDEGSAIVTFVTGDLETSRGTPGKTPSLQTNRLTLNLHPES